ncbi:ATP-dependent dethiobiotin synthetase BioD [Gordonia sp. HNM0687]|uniref:ATP-dependent dethiobiotin synthetase BioD n=1 Tax=Gordonia mangrovi TaxID=2665643 RepID=A0A6L7GMQ4_9ACTN|nr:dethiobiotin synthase [Gordonia mangrovi]MXP21166.1 ATP-dependent dethiobiotin synthetase BioD [Gordonia mangrovi]UVF78299.1 dethiobiotin synthase [Gordonia mangrovi]
MTASSGRLLAVAGTSTDVGKTVVTAALVASARAAGLAPAVCKPAQTGVGPGAPGDLAVIENLAGAVTTAECARYPDPLAPETAARLSGMPPLDRTTARVAVDRLARAHEMTFIEGAGGVLVRLAPDLTLLDLCADVGAPVVVVVPAGLGALNHAELTVGAVRAHGLRVAGLVIGSWPADPDLAMRCNRDDLPRLTGTPVVGVIPAGAGALGQAEFSRRAPSWFDRDWLARELAPTAPTATTFAPTAT